jgi:serine phosphatase RsbU (regulator of sigma subunit)
MRNGKIHYRRILYILCFTAAIPATAFPQQDTVAVQEKIDKARALFAENPALSLKFASDAYELAKDADNRRLLAYSLNTIGSAYNYLGKNDSSVHFHQRALEIQKETDDELGMGRSLTNLGIAYTEQGLHDKAIDCFLQAEQKFNRIGFNVGLSKLYNSLGALFYTINDYNNSIRYYKKGIELSEKLDDPVLNYSLKINLANVYGSMGHGKEALSLYREGYAVAKADSNYSDLVMICNNICHEYIDLGMFDSAKVYSTEALSVIHVNELEKNIQLTAFSNQAAILSHEGRNREAVVYVDSALKMVSHNTDLNKEIGLKHQLGLLLSKSGELERSIEVLKEVLNLKDTLYKKNLEEKLSEINTIHEVEKKESQIQALSEAQQQQKLINYLLAGVVLVSVTFLVVAIRNYRRKKRDNIIIEQQKNEVSAKNSIIEHKQQEIIDSITYGKRLQDAILPSSAYWNSELNDSFIYYCPKDIVAGDFYWMERAGPYLYVAAADSTGHGVPGAMVSVVCSNALNRSLLEFKLSGTGAILDKARELVIATFEKSNSEVKDGMDISLLRIDLETLGSNQVCLQWSGANNSLYYTQNGTMETMKADKQPIGRTEHPAPFQTHDFVLAKGEMLYLVTDGFSDQFGGEKGKKFMSKNLKELLMQHMQQPAREQKELLDTAFSAWKGALDQVDDITVIGIRI